MSVYIFRSRGTGEPYGTADTMLGAVTDRVFAAHPGVVVEDVIHAASMSINNPAHDPLAPSGENCANAVVAWLNRRVSRLNPDDLFIVLGYSLGAVGTTRWLRQYRPVAGGPTLLMVGHVANPSRRETTSYGLPYTAGASGIYSTQGTGTVANTHASPLPLIEIVNPADVMTTCYAESPLHAFSGPVMAFTATDPGDLVEDLIDGGIEQVMASVLNFANWFRPHFWTWAGELHAFMTGGVHTTAYHIPMWRDSAGQPVSGVELLARQCSWRITRATAEAAA